jgi:hypothetical protein
VLTEKKYGKAKLCWYMFTTEKCVQDDVPLNYFGEIFIQSLGCIMHITPTM